MHFLFSMSIKSTFSLPTYILVTFIIYPVYSPYNIVDFSLSKKGWAGIRDIDKAVVKEAEADAEF